MGFWNFSCATSSFMNMSLSKPVAEGVADGAVAAEVPVMGVVMVCLSQPGARALRDGVIGLLGDVRRRAAAGRAVGGARRGLLPRLGGHVEGAEVEPVRGQHLADVAAL